MRKLTASIGRSNCMVIFINQIRMKIGVMFGSPETTTGGNALKFYASVRLDIRRIGAIKDRDEVVGNQTRVKVVKNKVAPPFKQVEFDIMYGEGISKTGELLDIGVKAGLVEKSGSWFSYDSQRLGQGRENSKAFLKANPEITAKIEASIRQNSGLIAEQILAGSPERDADGEDPGNRRGGFPGIVPAHPGFDIIGAADADCRCLQRPFCLMPLPRDGPKDQTSGAQLRTGEVRDSGFALMRALRCAIAHRGVTAFRPSLRRLGVVRDRRAGADQVAVAIDVVDAADRAPVLVGARGAGREAALDAAVSALPAVVGDVVHGVRRMAQRRGLDLPAALFDLRYLVADRDHGVAEAIQLRL
jgi:hypothetical protein